MLVEQVVLIVSTKEVMFLTLNSRRFYCTYNNMCRRLHLGHFSPLSAAAAYAPSLCSVCVYVCVCAPPPIDQRDREQGREEGVCDAVEKKRNHWPLSEPSSADSDSL